MHTKDFIKLLKENATRQERTMWSYLRNRRFKGYKFRRQVPMGPYIVDFMCVDKKLIIELDGDQHGFDENRKKDLKRTQYLEVFGFRVLRFSNVDFLKHKNEVFQMILLELEG